MTMYYMGTHGFLEQSQGRYHRDRGGGGGVVFQRMNGSPLVFQTKGLLVATKE